MTIKVLNLRSFISGQQPVSLEGGELCFNMTDRTLFVGNQSDSKTDFNGNSSSGVPGQGWFSMPMDAAGFGEYFLTSPDVYGQLPNNGDTLEWNSLLGHLEWVPGGGGGGGSSAGYLTTNSDVVAAPGANITAKLNSIISPSVALSGNTAIVQGVSGDLYEGVYTFVDDTWEFGSFYAQPVAAAIVYDNAVSGLSSGDVQGAIDELAAGKVNTPLTPPLTNQVLGWNGAGTEWVSSSGGTVTGVFGVAPIVIDDTDPLAPVVEVSAATTSSSGVVRLNNTTTSTSTTEAATANAVKIAYDLANTAEADAQQALADAAAATSIANTAEADAQLALSDAASAQSDATLAIGLANIAEADAQQALIDAAAAQDTADLALPLAGGNMSGIINFAGTQPTATILAANIVRLLDSTSSNSITTAATPNSVRAAYSLANGALPKVGGVMTGDITFHNTQQFPVSGIQGGSTTQTGVVQLLSSVSSISQSYAATPYAVKLAYDAAVAAQTTANAALPRTGGTMTGNIVFAPTQTFPSSSVADATTTSKGVVQIGTNIEVSSGIISVLDGNTTEKGVVQLTDALNSASTTLGLTASGGYLLQQQIDTLSLLSNLTFCGTINASTGLLTSVTDAGIAHGFTVGLPLPLPGLVTNDHFVVVSIPGTFTPPGGSGPVVCNQGDWIVGTEPTPAAYEWSLQPVGYDAPSATTTVEGVTYLATNLEVQTGTDTSNKAVNPASLQSKLSDSVSLTSSTTIASSTAVKEAYDLAAAAIPDSVFDAVGDMVVATGADTYTRFAVGADGYILSANSSQANGVEWVPAPTGPGSAQPGVEGLVYGLTANSVSGYNVSLGYGANGTLTTGFGNVAIGGASGDMTSGSYNVAIGFDVNVSNPTFDKQLAIGPDAYTRWLTGDSSMNVKLGAGLVDALDSIGTSGQILSSTGTALQWINNTPDGVLGVTGTTPISVDNTDPQNPVVSVDAGTTLATGVVQLEDSVSSVSTTTAATPNSVKTAYDLANAALPKAGGTMSGDITLDAALVDGVGSPGTSGYILSSTATGVAWVANNADGVLGVTGTTPITVDNTDPANPVVGVDAGTTIATGVVQLEDSVSSTSITTAATPNSVKTAYDLANAALPKAGGAMSGDITLDAALVDGVGSPGTSGYILSSTVTGVEWVSNTADGVLGVTGTTPITVDNVDPANPVIGVDSGSLIAEGVLQLTDSTSSTSTTTAATPNSVKTAYDLADAAVPDSTYTALGDLVAGTGAGVYVVLPRGADDQVLAVDSATLSGLKWVSNTAGSVVGVTGTSPITVDNTDPQNPVVEVNAGSTTASGVVQLEDSVSSISTTTAATPNSVKTAYDLATTMLPKAGGTMSGDIILDAALVDGVGSPGTSGYILSSTVTGVEWVSNTADGVLGVTGNAPITVDNVDPANPVISVNTATTSALGAVQVGTNVDVAAGVISVKTGSATDLGVLQVGTNLNVSSGVINVASGSTTVPGILQLVDSISSTSITTAATPNSVKTAYDLANNAVPDASYTAAGDLLVGSGAGTYTALPAGAADYILASNGVGGLTWVAQSEGDVTGVTGTAPITVDNTDPQNPVVAINTATSTAFGTVLGCTTALNTYIGCNAGHPDAGNTGNIAIGDNALANPSFGTIQGTVALGYCALANMYDGSNNIALGTTAMGFATGGVANVALGQQSLNVLATGGQNIAIGGNAAQGLINGYDVIAIGDSTLAYGTDVCGTTAVGMNALLNSQGNFNTAIGQCAGSELTSGSCNTILGRYNGLAAPLNGTGSNHVVLSDGNGVVRLATNESGALSFDGTAYGTANQILVSNGSGAAPTWANNSVDGVQGVTGTAPITVDNTDPANPVISVNTGTTSGLGALQVGTNIDVAAGVISVKTANLTDLGVVQVGTNIDVAAGVISVADASTSTKGVVQLNNTTNNTSTSLALTAAQGKNLQDQIDALVISSNITLAGTFNASTGLVDSVTAAGTVAGFVVGNALPTPATGNAEHFVIVDVTGSTGPTGTPPYHVGDWFLSNGTAWEFLNVGFQAPAATTTVEGVVYLATSAEVQAGTDTSNKAVNPASLQSKVSDSVSTTDSYSIASSTAVKTAYDLANAAIPGSVFNTKGDIVVGTGNDTYGNFPSGTNGQILTVDSAETFGVKWVNNSADGVVGVTGTTPITVNNTDPVNPVIGVNAGSTTATGVLQLTNSVSSTSTSTAATPASVKTAYDLANAALPVNAFDAKGDTLIGTGSDSYARLPVGSNNSVLTADSATASGVRWSSAFVTSVTKEFGSPIQVNNTNPQVPVLSVVNATISSVGVTQLFDSVVSTSNSFAATPNSVKTAYDLASSKVSGPTAFQTAGQSLVVNNPALGTTSWNWRVYYLDSSGPITIGGTALVPIVGINSATTTSPGAVQLNDSTISTSATQALTANQGRILQEQINALSLANNLIFAGTIDASTANMVTVSAEGTIAGFAVGSPLPSAASGNTDFFTIVTVPGTMTPPGGSAQLCHQGDWWLSNGTAWNFLDIGYNAAYATTTAPGVIQLATDAEVQAGLNTDYAVVPSSLQSKISDSVSTTSSTTIASSTAVKTAYDLADAAIPDSTFTAAGDLLVGTGAGTYAPLSDGSAYQILTTDGAGVLSWVNNTADGVQGITGTAPITIDNTDPANPIVEIDAATTSISGAVQLYDNVDSTSTSLAATANAVKIAYDAAIADPMASATVLFVNTTTGNNATGTRGTGLPYQTVTAALAAASEGDTLYIAPGSYSESITLGKGVNIVGTYTDQTTACGPTFTGAFSVSISGAGSQNWAVTNVRFMGASAGTNTVTVSNNSFSSGGIGTFTNCFFEQFTSGSLTERCFITSGTWTKSLYMRNCSFSNNIEFASGAVNGTGSYVVVDNFYGTASVGDVFKIVSGTVEFRSPSQAMPPILQTGGTFVATNINSWLINSSATTSIFGGTGFSYKGTSVGLGSSAVYLVGQGNNVVEGVTWGKLSVGSNVIYGFNNVLYDTSLATLSGVPLNIVAPNANASVITQTRPQWQYLTTSSTVTAANQLGVALDSTSGKVYTVAYYDAGGF